MTSDDLSGKTAVVTGAARGIGRAIAERLGSDGAHVVVLDLADGSETVSSVEAAGGTAEYREADVTVEASLEAAVEGLTIDALVNNAGYYAPIAGREAQKRFDEIPRDEWETVMAVNTTGVFLVTKACLPGLTEGASVVNVSSGSVHAGSTGFLHYVTSKSALIGMTRSMANELGDLAIRVNVITPGLTASETTLEHNPEGLDRLSGFQSIGRPVEPTDIAGVVRFLVGPDSRMMTGQVVNVDGGLSFY